MYLFLATVSFKDLFLFEHFDRTLLTLNFISVISVVCQEVSIECAGAYVKV